MDGKIFRAALATLRGSGPALVAGLAALALYARTLAPGLTWAHHGADGGDLLAAALTGGVPHPTGYPTYQLLLRAATALYPGEPARAGNWLSALAAAVAVGLLADLARRILAAGWPDRPGWRNVCALAAALTWAASPLLWSQAVITEVYALHALAVVLVLWLLWRWRAAALAGRPTGRWLAATGLALGLGLGNHVSLALLLPAMVVWLWASGDRACGDRASGDWKSQLPLQSLPAQTGMDDTGQDRKEAFSEQIPGTQPWWALIAGLALGLSVYAYLPLAAAGDGPVNWGDPRTLAGFWWVVSGRPYAELFGGLGPLDLLARLAAWGQMALRQLGGGPWGLAVALAGLWWTDRRQHAWWRATGLVALVYTAYSLAYRTADSYVYLIPVWAVASLWLAAGLGWIGRLGRGRLAWPIAIAALLLLPAGGLLRSWQANDLSRDHGARTFVAAALAEAEPNALILTASDRPTFALWYARYGLGQRPDVIPLNVNLYDFEWYRLSLHLQHPELMAAADLCSATTPVERLVETALAQRPVYRAEPLNLALPGMQETPTGALVRIRPASGASDASE